MPIRYVPFPVQENQMSRIVITHAVQDVDRWLKGRDERAAALPGATDVTDLDDQFQGVSDRKRSGIA